MSSFRLWRVARGGILSVFLAGFAAPAYAGDTFQQCIDRAADHNGEPPTCTEINGAWVASWPGDGGGIPGLFVVFLVAGVLIAAAVTAWKVSTARRLASASGMDPGLATRMTLLTEDGLDATYLASSLRTSAPAATTPAAGRLAELKELLDAGLVTEAEYDAQRKAIIDGV